MNEEFVDIVETDPSTTESESLTQGMSSLYKLFEAFITLREKNDRQHQLFERFLREMRDSLQQNFNTFAGQTQKAYQTLRQDLTGEKKIAVALLGELLDVSLDLEHIVANKPGTLPESGNGDEWQRWVEAIEVENRKVQDALRKHGIHPYDAVVGSPYDPKLHERIGSKRMEGMDAHRIAEQREHGYASQHPDFVLRRPKVIVSE